MEKKKLHEYTRIDEKKVNTQQIFGPNRRCIAHQTDFNLKKNISQLHYITELNGVTSSRPECRANNKNKEIIDSNILLPSEGSNKDANFEYEEEWDIDGIPELLNELDADIEKSLTVDLQIHTSKFYCGENFIKDDLLKLTTNKSNERPNLSGKKSITLGSKAIIESSEKLILHSSTFAGFSKGGHLISTASLPTFRSLTSATSAIRIDSDCQPEENAHSSSMSSQAVTNNSTGTNVGSGCVSSMTNSQGGLASNSSTKSNTKMSIDHQATLDKGLKMKIKRTKPGTKSSEAKHEIVKATEQQQNGIAGAAVVGCNNNPDDNTNAISGLNSTSSTSQNNVANSTALSNTSVGGSKKNMSNNANQMNCNFSSVSNSCNNNLNSGIPMSNNPPQTTSLGTKRASSGHRRDKIKDKSSHSNRTVTEKSLTQNNEKELHEKSLCNCSVGDNSITSCSSNMCIRRNESTVAQRLSSSSSAAVPPGVFIPSADTPSTGVSAATLLSVSTSVSSSPVITDSSTISGAANTPGPPNREASSVGNIKISSHIAAQLAAAAASNFTNGSALTNTDTKLSSGNVSGQLAKQMAPGIISATVHHSISIPVPNNKSSVLSTSANASTTPDSVNATTDESSKSPPAKRPKHNDCKMSGTNNINKEMVDICIGTSVGTITEPDCLGPCEPGTSVTLEGIVWHETEGGVLVVNVTWRGKTYVGTLLDCTRHDWAPPRFCDSPSDELDSRTPKGRGKRGRAVTTPDLSNFTETRSSIYFSHPHVHSKLRNGTTKGGRANSRTSNAAEKNNSGSSISSGNGGSTPSTSPTAFLPPRAEKRKSKDEPASPTNVDNDSSNSGMVNASGIPISASGGGLPSQPQSLINPVTGLNVQISAKKCKTSSPCAISPVLLECPEQDCSKKYKHANGLRYHQSHAHGNASLLDDDSMADVEDPPITPLHSPVSLVPTPVVSEAMDNFQSIMAPQPSVLKLSESPELYSKLSDADATSSPLLQSESTTETDGDLSLSGTCAGLLHTVTTQSNCAKVPPGSNSSSETANQGQQATDNDKINANTLSPLDESIENTVQQSPPEKSGVLRFGQDDSNVGNVSLLSVQIEAKSNQQLQDPMLSRTSSPVSEPHNSRSMSIQICKDSNKTHQQVLNSDSFNDSTESCIQNSHNLESIQVSNKTSSSSVSKLKRNRKSPAPTEFDVDGFNTCNAPSREDVQSPAYSDISDDSTPVNDQQLLEKPHHLKNSDIVKKSPDMVLSSGSGCPSSVQSTMPSPLGGYGVYQFYQQQQFLVQPSIEPQQSSKNSLTTNIVQPTISVSCTPQQSPNHTELNRKEPTLELITKPTNSTMQIRSPTPQDTNKEMTQAIASNQSTSGLSLGSGALSSSAPSKSVSHFYAFNYMSPNYPFNVDQNYVPVPINAEDGKGNRHTGILSPTDQHQSSNLFKEDRGKELNSPNETSKVLHQQQTASNKPIKSEPIPKAETLKTDAVNTTSSQMSHLPLHNKDLQGMGGYTSMYQRHPMTLTSQQLSREEELRRYYIFSDQQRRQSSTVSNINVINQQGQGFSTQSSHQQSKDESASAHGNPQTQQQIKIKSNVSLSMLGSGGKNTNGVKEAPKQKQEDEIKVIKQEGQKPTMETQGPPPPPTSQYFLHPSYIAPTPFGFDPNHPMYRNVLMPPTSPYNTPPYHLPMPRYHAPEDLSRNTGTKALDVLHHAASQYYTTHKIHELSERALKSPNSGSSIGNTVKASVSSPTIGTTQHSNLSANPVGHHSSATQPPSSAQLSHNLGSQTIVATSNKLEITGPKSHGNGSSVQGVAHNETQKPQTSNNSTGLSNNSVVNANSGGGTDSRSPPPQRHVHTHHHTHVGLGYPMYPAPYGAAVLASQQAAAVAVINPFPPGPSK